MFFIKINMKQAKEYYKQANIKAQKENKADRGFPILSEYHIDAIKQAQIDAIDETSNLFFKSKSLPSNALCNLIKSELKQKYEL